eukprot:SAG11_NODE_93_length_17080_cov_10.504093_19_plen_358_part_00
MSDEENEGHETVEDDPDDGDVLQDAGSEQGQAVNTTDTVDDDPDNDALLQEVAVPEADSEHGQAVNSTDTVEDDPDDDALREVAVSKANSEQGQAFNSIDTVADNPDNDALQEVAVSDLASAASDLDKPHISETSQNGMGHAHPGDNPDANTPARALQESEARSTTNADKDLLVAGGELAIAGSSIVNKVLPSDLPASMRERFNVALESAGGFVDAKVLHAVNDALQAEIRAILVQAKIDATETFLTAFNLTLSQARRMLSGQGYDFMACLGYMIHNLCREQSWLDDNWTASLNLVVTFLLRKVNVTNPEHSTVIISFLDEMANNDDVFRQLKDLVQRPTIPRLVSTRVVDCSPISL